MRDDLRVSTFEKWDTYSKSVRCDEKKGRRGREHVQADPLVPRPSPTLIPIVALHTARLSLQVINITAKHFHGDVLPTDQ